MNMQQYKVNLKLNILKEVTSCQYESTMKDLIVNSVFESMVYSDPTQSRICKKTFGNNMIIMVSIIMKCSFKGKIYHVPVIIYFSKKMPYEPPQFYIDLPMGKATNPNNREIDPNTRQIMTMRLLKWVPTTDITSVLNEIQESFNRQFPIVTIKDDKQRMNQSMYNQHTMTINQQQQQQQQQQINPYNQQTINQSHMSNPYSSSNNTIKPKDNWTVVSTATVLSNQMVNTLDKISSNQQSLFHPEQADEILKQVLQSEIIERIDGRLKEENNKLLQQKERLLTYQKLFNIEEKKIENYLSKTGNIQQMSNEKFKEKNFEISNVRKYLAQHESKTLKGSNIMDYITIGNERNEKIISLIAQEAMAEELMSLSKRAFERQSLDLIDAIKFVRAESRMLFKVRFSREKFQEMNYNTNTLNKK